jgi:PEGA domain
VPSVGAKRSDTPPFLTAAISRALSKEPDQRFPTMEEFATGVWPEQPVAVPKAGGGTSKSHRRPPPPRTRTATADAPTEMTSAPTTPIPRASARIPAGKKQRSSVGMLVGGLLVVAAGVGGYLALGRKSETPPASSPQAGPAPAPPPAAVETVRVAANPPPPPRRGNDNRRQAAPPPAPPAAAEGTITVAADPYGEVFIDGTDVGQTPVVDFSVSVGRHTIRVERAGYKTVNETVQVSANNPVRKRYTLLPE